MVRQKQKHELKSDLGVLRAHCHCLCHLMEGTIEDRNQLHDDRINDLFVNYDVNFNTLQGLALEKSVQTPFLVICGGATEVQLGAEPPVLEVT